MTKMTKTAKERKGIIPVKEKRNFTPQEALNLQGMMQTIHSWLWIANLIKGNTALVPKGQEMGEIFEAIARLIENDKNAFVSKTLTECGYDDGEKVNINLATGEITKTEDEPASPEKPA